MVKHCYYFVIVVVVVVDAVTAVDYVAVAIEAAVGC